MLRFVAQHPGDEPLRRLAALMLANCFSEVKSMSKAVYGYYHYAPATLNILRRAADICRNSDVPGKKSARCAMREWIPFFRSCAGASRTNRIGRAADASSPLSASKARARPAPHKSAAAG